MPDRGRTAFLIWEMTFYGKKFPDAFRQRNIRAWHYIMSFSAVRLACGIGMVVLLIGLACDNEWKAQFSCLIVLLALLVTFHLKGKLTKGALMRLESAAHVLYEKDFVCTRNKLVSQAATAKE
jgi:hypothetical protein